MVISCATNIQPRRRRASRLMLALRLYLTDFSKRVFAAFQRENAIGARFLRREENENAAV
jgi:hypothetical protein